MRFGLGLGLDKIYGGTGFPGSIVIPIDDYIGWWKGDYIEIEGLTYLKDYSDNDYHALAKDSVLTLDGVDDYVQLPFDSSIATDDFSIVFRFVMPSSLSADSQLFCASRTENWMSYSGFKLERYTSDDSIKFSLIPNGGGAVLDLSETFVAGEVYEIGLSIDRDGYERAYLNGVFDRQIDISGTSSETLNSDFINIGKDPFDEDYQQETVSRFTIYSGILSDADFLSIYNGGEVSNNRVYDIRFNEGNDSVAYDISENSNDGTITGGTWGVSKASSFYNWKSGCDIWQKDSDDSYLCVPLDSSGDSIKTDGDTITGYTWVYKSTSGQKVNNPFTTFNWPFNEDTEASDLPIKTDEDTGYWFSYDTITGYKTNGTNNYVDTGITTENTLDWELTGRFIGPDQTKTQVAFGSREDISTDKAFLGYSSNSYIFNWGSVGGAFQVEGNNRVDDRSHTFKKDGDDFVADGVTVYSGLDSSGLTSDNNLFFAALSDNDSDNFHCEYVLERLRIWNSGGTLLYDIAPDGSGNFYDDVAGSNVTINGDALTAIDETSEAGAANDITYLDRHADVYDSPELSYNTIFSDISTDWAWKNIIAYSRQLEYDEWRTIYEYINHPNKPPLVLKTNDAGEVITNDAGQYIRLDANNIVLDDGSYATGDDTDNYIVL